MWYNICRVKERVLTMRMKELQSKLYQNRIDKGYSEIDIDREFCGLYSKVASAYKSYRKGKDKVGNDFAEIVLTLLNFSLSNVYVFLGLTKFSLPRFSCGYLGIS